MEDASDNNLKRKATLLLGEVLELANHSLPGNFSPSLQLMPTLLTAASRDERENFSLATGMIYQVDRVTRTLQRSDLATKSQSISSNRSSEQVTSSRSNETAKPKLSTDMDDLQFRSLLLETQVLATVNYLKWKWDLISDIIEGPLLNPKRLEEAIKASKFLKRLIGFYRPFKYRFSDAKNTKPNQRYVRTGCALIKTLLTNNEGIAYLSESKLLRQLAECLAQLDRVRISAQLTLYVLIFLSTQLENFFCFS